MVGILASEPSWPGFNSQRPQKISEENIVDVAKFYQSGLWLENFNQTHQVLASGKLVNSS